MMIIYTSGTTGRPKGAVHVHGGFLVKIAEECAFQSDVHADDVFTWISDMGWIMGPKIVVGAGALGATLFVSLMQATFSIVSNGLVPAERQVPINIAGERTSTDPDAKGSASAVA